MKITFECYLIYFAILYSILTGILAFNLQEENITWVVIKILNCSLILLGPILFTICLVGFYNIKGIAKVCNLHGIETG